VISAFRLRGARVDFASSTALDAPHLDIEAAAITAVVGPNGSGKSTLLRVLSLLQPLSNGTLEVLGTPVGGRERELLPLRRRVTYVAQSPLLFRRSVRANLAYGLGAGGRAAQSRLEAALEVVGLAGFADRAAAELSGGEAQAVALARAIALDRECVICDEPTAHLDQDRVPLIEAALAALRDRGKTVVVSTHDLEQACRLTESVVALDSGRLVPAPRLNVLAGVTRREGDQLVFASGDLRIALGEATAAQSVSIDADDILVSRAPLDSSARNCIPGTVTALQPDQRGILVNVDCGRPLTARITSVSQARLALAVGDRVYLTFKAMATHPNR